MKKFIYRVIDANFNRAREGLRVCEEFVRFFSNDKKLTRGFKGLRSRLSRLGDASLPDKKSLFSARDVERDVGRRPFSFERKRSGPRDIFWANLQRSKEALRVLEEFSKLGKAQISDGFRRIRYRLYEIEKESFKKFKKALK